MKQFMLMALAAFLVFGLKACDNGNGRKCDDPGKCPDKQERHERRW